MFKPGEQARTKADGKLCVVESRNGAYVYVRFLEGAWHTGEVYDCELEPVAIPEGSMRVGPGTDAVVWRTCPTHKAQA